jgi:hypothetical protein
MLLTINATLGAWVQLDKPCLIRGKYPPTSVAHIYNKLDGSMRLQHMRSQLL